MTIKRSFESSSLIESNTDESKLLELIFKLKEKMEQIDSKIRDLKANEEIEIKIANIRKQGWLSDIEINSWSELLKNEFGAEIGLEDTLVLANPSTASHRNKTKDFLVQIMLSRKNHWICIQANKNKKTQAVYDGIIFDSLPRKSIDSYLGNGLLSLSNNRKGNMVSYRLANVQRQSDDLCGYFACAFATAICYGLDPEIIFFKENEIVEHFINILYRNKKLKMFPFHTRETYTKGRVLLDYKQKEHN